MPEATLTTYMRRAGIRSRRELSSRTGIAHSTLDDIFKYPARARGYQLAVIMQVCGLSADETVNLITEGGNNGKTKKGNKRA